MFEQQQSTERKKNLFEFPFFWFWYLPHSSSNSSDRKYDTRFVERHPFRCVLIFAVRHKENKQLETRLLFGITTSRSAACCESGFLFVNYVEIENEKWPKVEGTQLSILSNASAGQLLSMPLHRFHSDSEAYSNNQFTRITARFEKMTKPWLFHAQIGAFKPHSQWISRRHLNAFWYIFRVNRLSFLIITD